MLCTLLCGSPSSVDHACWLRYRRFCATQRHCPEASSMHTSSLTGHARRMNGNVCIVHSSMLLRTWFVHKNSIFLPSRASQLPCLSLTGGDSAIWMYPPLRMTSSSTYGFVEKN